MAGAVGQIFRTFGAGGAPVDTATVLPMVPPMPSDTWDSEGETEELLPDVSGLTPVRTLAELRRRVAESGPRERRSPLDALRHTFGYDAFRPLQGRL
jgi:hypothetical protein